MSALSSATRISGRFSALLLTPGMGGHGTGSKFVRGENLFVGSRERPEASGALLPRRGRHPSRWKPGYGFRQCGREEGERFRAAR